MIDMRLPVRQPSLTKQVAQILYERIRTGLCPVGSQLPPESELAEILQVSRATVRSALALLEVRGAVKRRQGAGTFVSRFSQISNPLNEVIDFFDLIDAHGFESGFKHLSARFIDCDEALAQMLGLEPGGEVLEVNKMFTADGEPVIYCVNLIPSWVYEDRISRQEISRPGATEPLFELLRERCNQVIDYYVASVRPDIAQNIQLNDHPLSDDPFTPVLVIDEVGYNDQEQAILREVEYLLGDRMQFELVRHHPYA